MCYAVYIGTSQSLELEDFVPEQTVIYFTALNDDDRIVSSKFTKPNIYYVGSDTGCSCGFALDWEEEQAEDPKHKRSAAALVAFLKLATLQEDIEYYCCWEGDWGMPTEHFRKIDPGEIFIDNYFNLVEKEFIHFSRSNAHTDSSVLT